MNKQKRYNIQRELTAREVEIIGHLSEGKTYSEIAGDLYISTETVRRHASNIYAKLNVKNRMKAVRKYFG